MLAEHVHPSVVAMARTLLAGATIVYEGDPLRDLTLSAFLDKFVQKKPKVIHPDADLAFESDCVTLLLALARQRGEGLLQSATIRTK